MTQYSRKHHYVPRCYLKGWAGTDSKVCEYQRLGGSVRSRRIHPSGTGYKNELYRISTNDPTAENIVEDVFLKRVDQVTADALDIFRDGKDGTITPELRVGWARFIMSMLQRSPDKLAENHAKMLKLISGDTAEFEEEYRQRRHPNDPETLADAIHAMDMSQFDNMGARVLPQLTNLKGVGQAIIDMDWSVKTLERGHRHSFLTSDTPIVMSNGLGRADAHIAIPIGPTKLFVAARNDHTMNSVHQALATRDGVGRVNAITVQQANRFVYGEHDGQLAFVEKRLRL